MVANNPQSFMNGYLSAMRNSIITVSLGVAIYGFSRSFKKINSRKIMKNLSVLVYFFSFLIILNSNLLLRQYLNTITEEEKNEMPNYIDLNTWKRYEYLGWFLNVIVFVIVFLGLKKNISKLFKFMTNS
jgi:ABC-type Fe3+ transport system permease subunit